MKMTILTNSSVVRKISTVTNTSSSQSISSLGPGSAVGEKRQKGVIALFKGDFVSFLGIYIYMERLIRPRVRIAWCQSCFGHCEFCNRSRDGLFFFVVTSRVSHCDGFEHFTNADRIYYDTAFN